MNECIEQVENIENKIINYSIRIHECTEIILCDSKQKSFGIIPWYIV